MIEVALRRGAWHGDTPYSIQFPDEWDVTVVGDKTVPPLDADELRATAAPAVYAMASEALGSGRATVGIVVDDLTRPTPAAPLVAIILEELQRAGAKAENVTVFIAGGTHKTAVDSNTVKKTGPLPPSVRVEAHDSLTNLESLGRSGRGTPIWVNKSFLACDIKIGIGAIFPHPSLAFSGGSKLFVPGLAGFETVRHMHDTLLGAKVRGGELENEFRHEVEEITDRIKPDLVINAVVNQERQIAAVFVGDTREVYRKAVQRAREFYSIQRVDDADVIITDMYPVDTNIQFALNRGTWPLEHAKADATGIMIAACPEGVGGHVLFPVKHSFRTRALRRLRYFRWQDIWLLPYRLKNAIALIKERRRKVWMLSKGIQPAEFKSLFPAGRLYQDWDVLLRDLRIKHSRGTVRVVVYRCAPFLIPV